MFRLKEISPRYRAAVKPALQITIPIDIQMSSRFFSAPKIIPSAVPNGDPNSSGDSNPKPMIPYLFQILYILDFFKSSSVPYRHLRNLLLRSAPAKAIITAAKIEPSAEVTAVTRGDNFKIKPSGIASHNSTSPAMKTVNMLII